VVRAQELLLPRERERSLTAKATSPPSLGLVPYVKNLTPWGSQAFDFSNLESAGHPDVARLLHTARKVEPPPTTPKPRGVCLEALRLLPNSSSSKNFATCVVVDFAAARKRHGVARVPAPAQRRDETLPRAIEWERQLAAGEVRSRAEIARREGLSRARVT
jgi:hypothetical protein